MPDKVVNIGVTLSFTREGGSPTQIPEETLFSVTPPAPVAADNEFAPVAKRKKSYRPGQVDPGQLLFGIYYDPADPVHQELLEMAESGEIATWTLTHADPGESTEEYLGYVQTHSYPEIAGGNNLQKNFTVKVTED